MRTIVNLILHGCVLWAAWQLFPNIVQFDSLNTLFLVTIALWVISIVISLFAVLIFGASVITGGVSGAVVGAVTAFILILCADVIGLDYLSFHLGGFMVVGFWPKVILAILFSVFSVGDADGRR